MSSEAEVPPNPLIMMMSSLTAVEPKPENTDNDFIEVNKVRIIPSSLWFIGAYDGKKFKEKFRIINVGERPAFIRIFPTTSTAFKLKPLPKGVKLSTGMSIIKYVKFTFNSAVAVPQALIYIYINEQPVYYPIEVQIGVSHVKITPRMLHFGDIDIGTSSEQLSMFLENLGQKTAQFTIDLGRNDLELIVDPMRGIIQPGHKTEVKVEILGSRQGKFIKEFWVKTEPLQRIWISGTFIQPKLKIEHPVTNNFDHIVIDFPKTYYNAQNSRIVVIKNESSTNSMFCTVAEYKKNEDIKLDHARELNENLKFFCLNPVEGRLLKSHKAAVTVTFAPYRVKTFPQKFCIIFIKIMKINYRDGVVKGKDIEVKTFSSGTEADQYQITDNTKSTDSLYDLDWKIEDSYIRICLYGEVEEVNVKVTPSTIDRNNLRVSEESKLNFNIKNNSQHLPITFKYDKIACFKMEPAEATLKPQLSTDVLVTLKPHSMGQYFRKLNLVLYFTNRDGVVFKVGNAYLRVSYTVHYDETKPSRMTEPKYVMGISSPYLNDVGHLVNDVKYNTADITKLPVHAFVNKSKMKDVLHETCSELIAFPNDRPQWFHPWRSETKCTTIFTKLPRYNGPFDYTMTYTLPEWEFKRRNTQKYIDYMENGVLKHREQNETKIRNSCYPTSESKVLLTNEKFPSCLSVFSKTDQWPKLVPLTPGELMDIEITPRYVILGKIAPDIVCNDFFEIKNNNIFPITIAIIALSNCVIVKGKKRLKIEGNKSAKLYFECYSYGLGKYYVPVYIIINDYHIFDATVFAEVVPTTVKCKLKEVMINAKDNVGYLELFNPVNCAIDFAWEVQEKNYDIMPKSGKIESRKSLYCKIVFTPKIESVFRTEIYLLSQSGAKQIVKVSNEQVKTAVKFSAQAIEIKNIPLNITVSRQLVIRNESEQAIVLYVKNPDPIKQINISPVEGFVEGKCDIFFKITVHFKTIKTFSCTFEFVLLDGREHTINVYGNVSYPNLILEPEFMHIPKIITSAYQRRIFRINNNCWSTTTVKFLLENYPDLSVTDINRKKIETEITLAPKDYVELYLEFQPKEPTAYTFYLPYIINNFLGPPLLNNPNSFKIGTYLEPPSTEISRQMPTLRITCAAGAPWFKFSEFDLKFTDKKPENKFQVTNISAIAHQIKFITEGLESCFEVSVLSNNGKYTILEKLIKVSLEPQEKVILGFIFNAEDYGNYESDVPFYVKRYFENCPFNYIRLYGCKYKPTIEAKNRMIMIQTIPVNKMFTKSANISLIYHKNDCVVSLENNHEFIRAELKELKEKETMEVIVTFHPMRECNVVSELLITCTCNATCTIYVTAACDNCSLLSYRHKMKCWKDSRSSDCQDAEVYLRKLDKLNEILENYIFSEGFFLTYYFRIPATISRYPYTMYTVKTESKAHKVRKEKIVHLPIVTLFKNLTSANVVHHIIDGVNAASLDERQGTSYDYGIYKNVLRYLESYHVFVKNLNPELLLNYDRYIVFKTMLVDEENMSGDEILSEADFNFLSRQCWLDLLLKMFKLFHYDRLLKNEPPLTGKLEVDDIYSGEFGAYYSSQIESFPSDTNECEAKLMLWVEFHYKEQKGKLWPDKDLPDRKIRDLSKDVRDSLPIATLMAAYCPYLCNIFRDIYFEESDITGHCPLHHNACLISEAWNRLDLSFKISTNSIFEPTNTEMLFLLSYLYVVIPNYYPLETTTIKSHLGKTSSAKVILKNSGPVAISYYPKLFLNDTESFHIDSNHILIPTKGEKAVLVSYTAKQIIKEQAVLVFSGESGGEKFSKGMAINLIGIPDILYYTQEFKVKVELYETVSKTINVISPYAQSYHANTYFYLFQEGKPPLTMNDFVSVNALPGLPRQLELDGVCAFNDEGMHKLTIKMCFVALGDWIYYIYFLNKEVGIFSMKIMIRAELTQDIHETLPVKIHTNFDPSARCKCKPHAKNLLCPRILYADIPFQNKYLLEGLRNMIKIYAKPDEIEFWNTHLVFSKGFHIFRAYLENTYHDDLVPFSKVLYPTVSFNTSRVSNRFSVEPTIHFEDTTSQGTYRLLIHWDSSETPDQENLYLLAQHGLEPRNYRLKFWSRETKT
ncbi:unnamed protein product [Psylliodes chrysocephalus]|uniref:Uncharacterized protein n=1 Tax=Psylliodes chrysocephalus TaxID=3402493 RepID=A0A9P0GGK3_9CUCU|nr:unnamed protein product [Psylliodes chrysocephala]